MYALTWSRPLLTMRIPLPPLGRCDAVFLLEVAVEGGQRVVSHAKGYLCHRHAACQEHGGALHAQVVDILQGRHAREGNHVPLQGGLAQARGLGEPVHGQVLHVVLADIVQGVAQAGQDLILILPDNAGGLHAAAVPGEQCGGQATHGSQVPRLHLGSLLHDHGAQLVEHRVFLIGNQGRKIVQMGGHGLQARHHHQLRAREEMLQINIKEVPQALLMADGLRNVNLPGVNNRAAPAAEGDDLPVHMEQAAAPLAVTQLKKVVIMQRFRLFQGLIREQFSLGRHGMLVRKNPRIKYWWK